MSAICQPHTELGLDGKSDDKKNIGGRGSGQYSPDSDFKSSPPQFAFYSSHPSFSPGSARALHNPRKC